MSGRRRTGSPSRRSGTDLWRSFSTRMPLPTRSPPSFYSSLSLLVFYVIKTSLKPIVHDKPWLRRALERDYERAGNKKLCEDLKVSENIRGDCPYNSLSLSDSSPSSRSTPKDRHDEGGVRQLANERLASNASEFSNRPKPFKPFSFFGCDLTKRFPCAFQSASTSSTS